MGVEETSTLLSPEWPSPLTAPIPFWMNKCSSSYWTWSSHRGWGFFLRMYVKGFSPSKLSSFFIIVIPTTNWKNMATVHCHCWCSKKNRELPQLEDLSNPCYNIFKKLQFFSKLKVSLDFQFGFKLTFIFALLVFKVNQYLDFASTSSVFRQLKLVVVIIVKSTVVGMISC
jgi:hypothetical protein